MKIQILLICFSFGMTVLQAQSEHKSLLQGTEAYQKGDYETASEKFQSAIAQNNQSVKGNFNLGNSYFKRQKYDEALPHFQDAVRHAPDEQTKSKAFYNLGNTYLAKAQAGMQQQGNQMPMMNEEGQEALKKAIDAYKEALRSNSSDFEAKNNLAMAYKLLRQQQQQQQQQQQKNEEKENEDQKNQQSPPEKNENENPEKSDDQNPKGTPQDLEKKEIDRMMKRIEEEDKKVQEKLMKRKQKNTTKNNKDW